MSPLDRFLPTPRLHETDHVDLAIDDVGAWLALRHGDLSRLRFIRALLLLRSLPETLAGKDAGGRLRIDDLGSTPDAPGFQVLEEVDGRSIVVGAVGKPWEPDAPFVHVDGADGFRAMSQPGYVRIVWALSVDPIGDGQSRISVDLSIDGTSEDAWRAFRSYFLVVGPAARVIRRTALAALVRELGGLPAHDEARALPGDELVTDAADQITHAIDIEAPPAAVWPWLVQMGGRRGGFYGVDLLESEKSAREIHPELQHLAVGQLVPTSARGGDGFEVLAIEPERALVFGGLYDVDDEQQVPFRQDRPAAYWQGTWAFVLEPIGDRATRLYARARTSYSSGRARQAAWLRPVHRMMETMQLRHLKARAEGTLPTDDASDVLDGLGGVARIALALATPSRRSQRAHWGLDEATAARAWPGDELVPDPTWSWTHGVEIDSDASEVWPWIAQIGATRAGFYSYQWLENLAGGHVHNAEAIHPEWELTAGAPLSLHPRMPPLEVVAVERGRWFVARAAAEPGAKAAGKPWVEASWLFHVEALRTGRCRLVSRYRLACSDDVRTRVAYGPTLLEPVGFAMDRRLLLGVKERAERIVASSPP